MQYFRFSHVCGGAWEVFAPSESTKPIATITRRRGKCLATITPDHTLNRAELACLLDFMSEREQAAQKAPESHQEAGRLAIEKNAARKPRLRRLPGASLQPGGPT